MRRKKLVIFCNDYRYFLAHRYPMFETLPESGVDVVAWCGGAFPGIPPCLTFPIRRYACDRYRFRPLLDLLLFFQMARTLIRERPDVVHTITIKPNLFGGLAARLAALVTGNRPRLVMASPGLGRVFSNAGNDARATMRRRLIARMLRIGLSAQNSSVFFENEDDRAVWVSERIVPRERTEVIAGTGVDEDVFHPVPDRPSPPPLVVLYAGRLLRSKGILSFVEIARRMERTGPDIRFLVAGTHDRDDPDSVDITDLDMPRNLEVLGHVSHMPALVKKAHVILLPTIYAEGLPRVLLEGAAMNCVLVASDIAGCRRTIIDGENGYLLPLVDGDIDVANAAERIAFLAENPDLVAEMGRRSREHFLKNGFDIGAVRRQVHDILFRDSR